MINKLNPFWHTTKIDPRKLREDDLKLLMEKIKNLMQMKYVCASFYVSFGENFLSISFFAKKKDFHVVVNQQNLGHHVWLHNIASPLDGWYEKLYSSSLFPALSRYNLLSRSISELLVDISHDKEFGEELIFSASLYLQFSWIKVRKSLSKETNLSILMKGYSSLVPKLNPQQQKLYKLFCEINDELVNKIYHSIFKVEYIEGLSRPAWLPAWELICQRQITESSFLFANEHHLLEMMFYEAPALINWQLGISKWNIGIQLYFINQKISRGN